MDRFEKIASSLRAKQKKFMNLMLLFMAVTLACLYFLPEEAKIWNLLPLGLAITMFVMSQRVQMRCVKIQSLVASRQQNKTN